MKSLLGRIDFSKILSYGYHLALLAAPILIQAYAPGQAAILLPLIQAVGQASPTPEGISILNAK